MITGVVILGVLLAFFGYIYYSMQKMKNAPIVADNPKIKNLTEQNFNQQTKNGVILVDFWASWCAPCKMMAPILNELAEELKASNTVGKLNVEQYQAVAARFKVRSIPTMILFKDGKEVNRFVGIKSKEFLLKEMARI